MVERLDSLICQLSEMRNILAVAKQKSSRDAQPTGKSALVKLANSHRRCWYDECFDTRNSCVVDIVATTTNRSRHRAHSHVVVAQRQQPGVSSLSYLVDCRAIPLKSSGKLSAEKVMNSYIQKLHSRTFKVRWPTDQLWYFCGFV